MSRPADASAEMSLLRELRQRRMGREGIPMVLALSDERTGAAMDARPTPDGVQLGDRLSELFDTLAARQRVDDIALVETLLQLVSFEDFTAVVQP